METFGYKIEMTCIKCDGQPMYTMGATAIKVVDKLKNKAQKLNKVLPAVFLTFKDKDTPIFAKMLAGIAVGYALSPIDLIPDFIPVLGYLDDVVFLTVLIALTIKCVPDDVWQRNLAASEGLWNGGRPKKWYYAIPIVTIWTLVAWLVVRAILL